ncbi:MAG: RluA family pseudouridine synthase [Chloroflexi bacterium]|nr:RluA family pseudouridine synthase [Chloroflexota bacterium]
MNDQSENQEPPRPKIEHVIDDEEAGLRLEQIVAKWAELAPAAAHALIERGAVWIDRQRVRQADLTVTSGAQLVIHFPPGGSYTPVTITPDDILWEDRWLLALNKRPGWHSNYTPWDIRGAIPYALTELVKDRPWQKAPLHMAHQLDRDTSGVLLVSKDPGINRALQELFISGGMKKRYLALATGTIERDSFQVETGHGRGQGGLFRIYPLEAVGQKLPYGSQRVKLMQTRFEVVARTEQATLVHAQPITGRTHQIRLHLAHLGHPILGDARYNGLLTLDDTPIPHHLLHAAQLGFSHPVTHQPILLRAPLPATWRSSLEKLSLTVPET